MYVLELMIVLETIIGFDSVRAYTYVHCSNQIVAHPSKHSLYVWFVGWLLLNREKRFTAGCQVIIENQAKRLDELLKLHKDEQMLRKK